MYFKFFFIIFYFFFIFLLEFIILPGINKFKSDFKVEFKNLAEPNEIYGYTLKKNIKIAEYEINSKGFRSSEFSEKKPKNTIRIFVVGGSTTFGSNAGSNEYTIAGILNYILNTNTKSYKFEVINAGVPGYTTWQNKLKVKEIFSYEPDLVFIMDGFVDALRAQNYSYKEIHKFVNENDKKFYEMSETQNKIIKYLIEKSEIIKSIKYLTSKFQQTQPDALITKEKINDTINKSSLKEKLDAFNTKNNLIDAGDFLIKNKINLVILKSPWIIDSKKGYESIKSNIYGRMYVKDIDAVKGGSSFYISSYEEVHSILNQVCENLEVYCIDLHKIFKENDDKNTPQKLFSDTFHFNRFGNFLISKHLSEFIFNNQYKLFLKKDILNLPDFNSEFYDKFLKYKNSIGTAFLENENINIKKNLTTQPFKFIEENNRYQFRNDNWSALYFDDNKEKILEFEFDEEINKFYFYPRVFGENSYVKLYSTHEKKIEKKDDEADEDTEQRTQFPVDDHFLFELNGLYNGQSDIAQYYSVETDFNFKTVKVVLKNSQIWFKNSTNNIFFKVY